MKSIKDHLNSKGYTLKNILGQAMWYSKNAVLSVSLMSGLGLPWNYDNFRIREWMDGINDEDFKYKVPENAILLRAVYKKGNPSFSNAYNGNRNDYQNYLWDDTGFKKTITPVSQSYLIINELMLAKYLVKDIDEDFENTDNIKDRKATALLLLNSALLQADFLCEHMRNQSRLFVSKNDKTEKPYGEPILEETDKPPTISEQAIVLEAFSLLANTLDNEKYPEFLNLDLSQKYLKNAQEIYTMFKDSPGDIYGAKSKELCNIISSCLEYSKTNVSSEILDYATTLAIELESRVDMSGNLMRYAYEDSLTSNSSSFVAVKALIQAYALTGIYKFLSCAQLLYKKLNLLWDKSNYLFLLDDSDKYKYTLRDIGSVLGGINAIRLFGDDHYKEDAKEKLINFFNTSINLSGILLSTAPVPGAEEYEGYLSHARSDSNAVSIEDFASPNIPQALDVSMAPVFGKKFTFKPKKKKFTINSQSFYSDYALYTINELLCLNYPEIECYDLK
ncbi:hypothetical protein OXPF_04130 [Oxobacter pfennigii]|uniref:Uncharacterized protein n=1 Tax=Oxobacter pfennigii TaxID=36849 RepID=A0A0P8WBE5_9CLOT|nr:hypothetical protein [Oxobacter pfennigii]KPU45945.1 hypothetical protein OXPF_04130 [Oxobacter pfennigii]